MISSAGILCTVLKKAFGNERIKDHALSLAFISAGFAFNIEGFLGSHAYIQSDHEYPERFR
jgi:hypothetical protein